MKKSTQEIVRRTRGRDTGFTHGTGFMDGNGFVHYTPDANYAGAANDPVRRNYALRVEAANDPMPLAA